jgi:hypothetical protein
MIWGLCLMHTHQNENSFVYYHVDFQCEILLRFFQQFLSLHLQTGTPNHYHIFCARTRYTYISPTYIIPNSGGNYYETGVSNSVMIEVNDVVGKYFYIQNPYSIYVSNFLPKR